MSEKRAFRIKLEPGMRLLGFWLLVPIAWALAPIILLSFFIFVVWYKRNVTRKP